MGTKVSAEQVLFESNYARVFKAVYLYCCSYNSQKMRCRKHFNARTKIYKNCVKKTHLPPGLLLLLLMLSAVSLTKKIMCPR